MSLQIGDTAPDFEAETTHGPIKFHDWIGDGWAVFFSHPKDFTPVCTTELGYVAKLKPEFDRRNVKLIGLSVDPVENHAKWAVDIKETQGVAPNYPMIGDTDLRISKLYGMLPAAASGDASARTPADNQTVRNVFVIGPDKKVKLLIVYPMTTGRNFGGAEALSAHRAAAALRAGRVAKPSRKMRARHRLLRLCKIFIAGKLTAFRTERRAGRGPARDLEGSHEFNLHEVPEPFRPLLGAVRENEAAFPADRCGRAVLRWRAAAQPRELRRRGTHRRSFQNVHQGHRLLDDGR
jgi:alkyl hydroperoxide reductase subunit AhpC